MSVPVAFTFHREASGPAEGWAITDPRVEQLWLPILGPTPYCILRVIDHELEQSRIYFDSVTLRMGDLADRVGTKVSRAWQSLLRLERAGLVKRDPELHRDEHPVFVADRSVRRIGDAEWARLPAQLRSRYSTLEL